jgi:hypothetical protein
MKLNESMLSVRIEYLKSSIALHVTFILRLRPLGAFDGAPFNVLDFGGRIAASRHSPVEMLSSSIVKFTCVRVGGGACK